MNWIIFEHNGYYYYCERLVRECFLTACMKRKVRDFGIVIKTVSSEKEAICYCEKINLVNNLIENL